MQSNPTSFSWRARCRSFIYAATGLGQLLKTEHNAWIHLATTVGVTIGAIFLKVSLLEMGMLFFAIALVWIAEMLNTCIEKTLDFITLEHNPEIKHIKDMAAGAVLIAALTAVLIGAIVFIPKIINHG